MRFYRFTANPQSSALVNGTVSIRLRFGLTNQMIHATFTDGALIAVPDDDMGQWGGPTDFYYDNGVAGEGAYLMFQETSPQIPVEQIPLWSSQLKPYSTDPQALPTPWPAVVVAPGGL